MNIFMDVGAHTGNTFPHLGPEYDGWTIFCFEPSLRHVPILIDTAKNLKAKYNIFVCPFGLGEFTKPGEFFYKSNAEGDSFFEGYEVNVGTNCHLVPMICSATEFILSATKPDDTVHLKLDCEGSEYGILKSLFRTPPAFDRVKKLYVEFHRVPGYDDNVRVEMSRECDNLGHPVHNWGH